MDAQRPAAPRRLIEFYDREYLDNVVSLLHHPYTAVTFVYFARDNEPDRLTRNALRAFIQSRLGLVPDFLAVGENTVSAALEAFDRLTREMPCEFDVTGGSSVFIAAAGITAGRFPERSIGLHEYDPAADRCCQRWPDRPDAPYAPGRLTVEEIMQLQKIRILEQPNPIRYDRKKDRLEEEALQLWEVVRHYPRAWNALAVLPGETDGPWVHKQMNRGQWKSLGPMLQALRKAGLLARLQVRDEGREVLVSYCRDTMAGSAFLYEKAGNLLELMTYLALDGAAGFTDCCTGVLLDWELEQRPVEGNPFNEIDVLAVRGTIPCFISCKNTLVKNEFLYEILTMARHFGGRYAIPVLATTARCTPAIRTRAREMGVILLDELGTLNGAEFRLRLQSALGPGPSE